ncbi:MAG TPA: hypothetical protein VII53_06610 [Solirubrobacteraceae bacterium]
MLAVHILAVVIGFGVTFAYPLFAIVGTRMDSRALPWFHRMQQVVGRRLINPALLIVLLAGVYLASNLHQWSATYVQWGLAAVVVLGGLEGGFMIPCEGRLADLAERATWPPPPFPARVRALRPRPSRSARSTTCC